MSKKLHELKNEGLKKIFVGGIAKACGDREPESLGEGDAGVQMVNALRDALAICIDDSETIEALVADIICEAAQGFSHGPDYLAALKEINQ